MPNTPIEIAVQNTPNTRFCRSARAEPEQLAYEASERYGYPAGFLARYFEKLRYRFGPRERAGLYTFLEPARDGGGGGGPAGDDGDAAAGVLVGVRP